MAGKSEKQFEDNKQFDDDVFIGAIAYRGLQIGIFRGLGGQYYAINNYGEPYSWVEYFDHQIDAINWDKKNADSCLDQ